MPVVNPSSELEVVRYGPHGLLVECRGRPPAAVAAALRAQAPAGVYDVVAGAATVVIECRDGGAADAVDELVGVLDWASVVVDVESADEVVIEVVFDGPDLDDVAAHVGLSAAEVVERLTAAELVVGFCGFAPGFAYLDGVPADLHVPRRETPRERIEPGSVAVAAGQAAVYPSASPGGWNLLGRTTAEIWSVDRDPPALLRPGARVRFEAVDAP